MKTYVFWQNIISPHQFPYIKEIPRLSSEYKVILVVTEPITSIRKKMGWNVDYEQSHERLEIIIQPNSKGIQRIIEENEDSYHFFSGLRAYPLIFEAFKYSLQFPVKRYLIAEGPSYYRKQKIFHYIKALIFEKKYFKDIEGVLAIGHHAREWYPRFGFKKNEIIPFSYCVVEVDYNTADTPNKPGIEFVYVGSLTKRKNVKSIIRSLSHMPESSFSFTIIGDGSEKKHLMDQVARLGLEDKVDFLGSKQNAEIRKMLPSFDVLILPSYHDGWGAVINEALMAGLFVVCSDKSGGKDLITEDFNGKIFELNESLSLDNVLSYCINHKDMLREKKDEIKKWSHCISPNVIADYLVQSINHEILPQAPWKIID